MNERSHEIIRGALSGFLATVPTTLVMEGLRRAFPLHQRYPLPPRAITVNAAAESGNRNCLTHEQEQELAWTAHYLFGPSIRATHGLLNAGKQKRAIEDGALFGCCVWAMSYQGWLPAFELHPAATEESPRRNILMVAAHVLWGVSTSVIYGFLRRMSGRATEVTKGTSVERDASRLVQRTPNGNQESRQLDAGKDV